MEAVQDLMLVIDAGTTGVRAVLVDKQLRTVASQYGALPESCITRPQPGWLSMDPDAIWAHTEALVRRVLESGLLERVRGLALTTQRASVLLVDEQGRPVTPFIPWQDARTGPMCEELNSSATLSVVRGGASFAHFLSGASKFKAGSVWSFGPLMAGTKVAWLLRNDPKLHTLAEQGKLRLVCLDSWLLNRLLGGAYWGTDRSNLNATGLYDPWTDGPNSLAFNLLKIPPSVYPRCEKPSACVWGSTPADMFGRALPVLALVSDQGAACMGEACFGEGEAKVTLGSGSFVNVTTGYARDGKRGGREVQYPHEAIYPIIAFQVAEETLHTVEAQEQACGTALDWVGQTFGLWDDISTTSATAFSVPNTSGAYFVPALFGITAPYNKTSAKGAFVGLSSAVTRAHLVRAVLEGITWRLVDLIEAINGGGGVQVKSIRVGGGVARNDFICQFLADLTGLSVSRAVDVEATVRGAAMLAGIAGGWFEWTADGKTRLRSLVAQDNAVFMPSMTREDRIRRTQEWHSAVDRVTL